MSPMELDKPPAKANALREMGRRAEGDYKARRKGTPHKNMRTLSLHAPHGRAEDDLDQVVHLVLCGEWRMVVRRVGGASGGRDVTGRSATSGTGAKIVARRVEEISGTRRGWWGHAPEGKKRHVCVDTVGRASQDANGRLAVPISQKVEVILFLTGNGVPAKSVERAQPASYETRRTQGCELQLQHCCVAVGVGTLVLSQHNALARVCRLSLLRSRGADD